MTQQVKFPYGEKFTKIIDIPEGSPVMSSFQLNLTPIDTLVEAGYKVTVINNDTNEIAGQWFPQQSIVDADKLNLGDQNLLWLKVRKKPVVVHALQIKSVFETTTMEGKLKGKAGDYLIIGVNGERYPIDREIFEKTYDVLKDETAIDAFVKSTTTDYHPSVLESLESVSPSFRDAVAEAMSKDPINIPNPDSGGNVTNGVIIDDDPDEPISKILDDRFKDAKPTGDKRRWIGGGPGLIKKPGEF